MDGCCKVRFTRVFVVAEVLLTSDWQSSLFFIICANAALSQLLNPVAFCVPKKKKKVKADCK